MTPADLPRRFAAKISLDDSGCWIFTGATTSKGYGSIGRAGRVVSTHRFAYELLVGPISAGMQLDHLCRVRACCNPAHLEPVTAGENVRRAPRFAVTHCPQGHPYAGPNLKITSRGSRNCRACLNAAARRRRASAA